jgi:hypothetical protein
MKKRTVIIIATVTLVVGATVGGLIIANIYSRRINRIVADYERHMNDMAVGGAAIDAGITAQMLTSLRSGDITNVIRDEEGFLESDLIKLEFSATNRADFISYPPYVDSLREVKVYRDKFPYKTNPDVEKNVAQVFDLLDGQTNR